MKELCYMLDVCGTGRAICDRLLSKAPKFGSTKDLAFILSAQHPVIAMAPNSLPTIVTIMFHF